MIHAAFRRNFRLLWSGQFLALAGLTVIVPLLPIYLRELGATDMGDNRFWSGAALAAPAISSLICAPLWGKVGDRWGRKWMVVRAMLGLGLCLALMGLVTSPMQFVLCRLLQGAFGGIVDASAAYVSTEAPEDSRGRHLGKLQSAVAAGSLLGPLFGGLAADWIGFRPVLLLMGALTAACGLWAAVFLREHQREKQAKVRERDVPVLEVFRELLTHRRTRVFLLAGVLAQMGVYGLVTFFGLHVEALQGEAAHAASWVGILQAVTWGAGIVGGTWWGQRNDHSSRQMERNFFWALSFCGLSIALQAFPPSVEWLIPLRLVQGFCFSALLPTVFQAIAQNTSSTGHGVRIGAANSTLVIGQILGSCIGPLAGGSLDAQGGFIVMGGLFLLGALAVAVPLRVTIWHARL